MKKIYTLLSIFISLTATAQININRNDYGVIGDYVKFAVDTPAPAILNSTILLSGANQTWNFSTGITANKYDSSVFASPSTLTVHPDSANLLIVSATGKQFQNVDSNFVRVILDRPNNNIKNLSIKLFKFPITYNTDFIDSINFIKQGTPADFNAPLLGTIGYDSVTAIIKAYDTASCIGWGTIQLPDTTCSVLQVKITTVSELSLYGHTFNAGWTNINSLAGLVPHQKTVEYQWIGKNCKSYIARATMDTNGLSVKSFTYALIKSIPPTIKSVNTSSAERGQTLTITINASNTHFTQAGTVAVKLYQGISFILINSVSVLNDTTLSASIIVSQNNPIGMYDIKVTDPLYGNITKTSIFQVNASTNLPSLIKVTPYEISDRPQTLNITLTGTFTHFTQGTNSVSFFYHDSLTTKITVNTVNASNDSTLVCNITTTGVGDGGYDIHTNNIIDGGLILKNAIGFVMGVNNLQNFVSSISIYPNPANEVFNILFTQQVSCVNISITDITGRLVKSTKTSSNNIQMNVSDLKNGIYFMTISGNDFSTSRKIIIHNK